MAVHNINWLISRLPVEERDAARALYQDNVRTLEIVDFDNRGAIAKNAAVMTQAQIQGVLSPDVIDISRLEDARRLQNFFEKYDRKALDRYLRGEISLEQLEKRIERIKKTDERYLKAEYKRGGRSRKR